MIVEATDVSGSGSLPKRERRLVYVNTDHIGWIGKTKIYQACAEFGCDHKSHNNTFGYDLVTHVCIDGTFFDFLEDPEHFLSDSNAVRPSPLKGIPR